MGRTYRELSVWQKSREFVSAIYKVTADFPKHEIYGLISQLRRAAVSIPSNIAEGQSRYSQKEFMHFISNARGSLSEVETQLLIAQDLNYVSSEMNAQLLETASHIGCMLNNLHGAIQRGTENGERRTAQ